MNDAPRSPGQVGAPPADPPPPTDDGRDLTEPGRAALSGPPPSPAGPGDDGRAGVDAGPVAAPTGSPGSPGSPPSWLSGVGEDGRPRVVAPPGPPSGPVDTTARTMPHAVPPPYGPPPPYAPPPAFGAPGSSGYGPLPAAAAPPTGLAEPGPSGRAGRGLGAVAAVALVAALLGGLIGGLVGFEAAQRRPVAVSPGAGPLPVDPNAAPVSPVEAVAARVLPSVVQLKVDGVGQASRGSGIVLSADGVLLTNNHVVESAAAGGRVVAQFQDGTNVTVRIVGRDPSSDLAVLRADNVTGLTPIAIGNSDAVRVGQQVVAFGSPLGLGGTVTTGIISALHRAVSVSKGAGASEATVLSALQTDAAINPGNSGGPLVDMQGALIGINSVIATTGEGGGSIGVGFSIPINQAKRVADELEKTGRATHAVLGVGLVDGGDTSGGAVIGQVVPGGPADQAGIKPNNVVTRVDERLITNGEELIAAIRDHAAGDRVTLTVEGRPVPVTLGSQTG